MAGVGKETVVLSNMKEVSMKIPRRDFLKSSVASATAFGLAPTAKAEEKRQAAFTPFSFAVVADPHCAEKPGRDWPASEYGTHIDRFMRCVEEMLKLGPKARPDFMLIVGDIHIWELRKHFDKIAIPMHVIAGNHEGGDRKKELRELFPQDFQIDGKPSDYYSFLHKGARFIGVCDSGRGGDHIGQLCSEDFGPRGQCEWLEKELNRPESLKFVFAHIPPHPQNADQNMFMSRNDSLFFNQLIQRTEPTAGFFGHQHHATSEYSVGNSRMITLRSCAWNFGKVPLGFMLVDVTPTGIVTREVISG